MEEIRKWDQEQINATRVSRIDKEEEHPVVGSRIELEAILSMVLKYRLLEEIQHQSYKFLLHISVILLIKFRIENILIHENHE